MQAFNIVDNPAEPYFLPVYGEDEENFWKRLCHACKKTHVSHVKANMIYGIKL